ncbi:YrzE family protein [Lyngbya confervoides]|uniref:MFS transporter n=1 Tax=Lyngbya confervoides BDU141951 TaxID=1574623 RepID=A0ABD4T1I2_9CYAN|nr:hypothetical protein [Lyngbya confervoides]MCM1982626.1 hypothetical protein [Lyngbya confervoides BDU141951]
MQLVFALLAGLVIAVMLQVVLTSLGIALGLTVLNLGPASDPPMDSQGDDSSAQDPAKNPSRASPAKPLPVTHMLGGGIALSLSIVLFLSALAGTEFSQIPEPRRGLVWGLMVWATYWLLLFWLSSTTFAWVTESLVGAAVGGSRLLVSTIGRQWGPEPENSAEDQTLDRLVTEVSKLAQQQAQFPSLLAHQRQDLLRDLCERTSLSAEQVDRVIHEVISRTQGDLPPVEASQPQSSQGLAGVRQVLAQALESLDLPSWKTLLRNAIQSQDGSDWDLETLWHQVQTLPIPGREDLDVIEQDVQTYLRHAPSWALRPEILQSEFYDCLYDPQADPQVLQGQILQIGRDRLGAWLQARQDLSSDQIETLLEALIEVRDAVIATVTPPHLDTPIEPIQTRLLAYCRYTNREALSAAAMAQKVQAQLEAQEGLGRSLPPVDQALDLPALRAALSKRKGLSNRQRQALMDSLTAAWPAPQAADRREPKPDQGDLNSPDSPPANQPRPWLVRTLQSSEDVLHYLQRQLNHYLRFQDKSALNPAQMAQDLGQILQRLLGPLVTKLPDPAALQGLEESWQQALEARSDLSSLDREAIRSGFQSAWQTALAGTENTLRSLETSIKEGLATAREALANGDTPLEQVRQQVVDQIVSIQAQLAAQAQDLALDLQQQAEAAKRQVQIAAWWLLGSLLLSGASAAIAGWLAVLY